MTQKLSCSSDSTHRIPTPPLSFHWPTPSSSSSPHRLRWSSTIPVLTAFKLKDEEEERVEAHAAWEWGRGRGQYFLLPLLFALRSWRKRCEEHQEPEDRGPCTDMLRKLVCRRICSCKLLDAGMDGWSGGRERLKERVDWGGGERPACRRM